MIAVLLSLGLLSFGAAAIAYAIVFVLLLPLNPRTHQSRWLLGATAISSIWALILTLTLWNGYALSRWAIVFDAVHLMAWILFIGVLLRYSGVASARRLGSVLTIAAVGGLAVVLIAGAGSEVARWQFQLQFVSMLVLPLGGLLGLEQIFRNSTFEEQYFLKPMAIAIGGIFVIDVFVYSQALLFGQVGALIWSLRGIGNAALAPLLILAVKRQPNWGENLFISRHVVFYSTSLTAVGLYLLAMALGGFVIGASGIAWGGVLQLVFLLLAGGVLFYVLFSQAVRNRFRVFIAKHFFRNRYDYREEWLRLIKTLADSDNQSSLPERSVQALAEIIGSPRGELWLRNRSSGAFEAAGAWRAESTRALIGADDVLVKFLRETHWVVDTVEYANDPEKYANAFVAAEEFVAIRSIYVPLIHNDELVGIVRLDRPPGLDKLSFEDHDLLKTAGQQVAIFLIQERAQEELSETRQFEAFSRLTAFLMHDLKNMIAQQELVVGNAKRFKHRPEFVDDAMSTIDSSVRRMRKVLERLQSAERNETTARVDLEKVLHEVVSTCADRQPAPRFSRGGVPVWVAIDRDKLAMAVTHAIRNSQDATEPTGRIEVRLSVEGGTGIIEVEDTGAGMDAEFIRDHLFKPFDTTKGAKGMGIGAYQIRETLRSVGGDVGVSSAPGQGTVVRMSLPLVAELQSPASTSAA